ncbi:MAG: hypothetical protein EP338_13365 [Bacteroidetes bacterium]|nr:MAG: hypothetical protein EP338_13365 [Bacteroidota bacterium]
MKATICLSLLIILLGACDVSGVKQKKEDDLIGYQEKKTGKGKEKLSGDRKTLNPGKELDEKQLEGGIRIKYFERGSGAKLKEGEVVKIDYEVLLADGTKVDGNSLLNKAWLPFMVGYGMQTPGWDIALKELKAGDFAEIYLPAKMARGEKGIKGLIPPNSPNIIRIKVLGHLKPTRVVDGTQVWLLEENKKEQKKADLESEVEFHYMVGTESNPKYDISYRRNQPYVLKFSDYGIIKGLKKALINAKKSDKIWVLVPPAEAYGSKGLKDLVKPNEHVFYDIFVMDVR